MVTKMKNGTIRNRPIDKSNEYVKSKFCYFLNYNNSFLIYDTLNTRLFSLNKEDYDLLQQNNICNGDLKSSEKINMLLNNYLIYEKEYDQINFMNYKIESVFNESTLQITILPTNACDFRCGYCFEKHGSDFMTKEIQNRIKKYLRRQIPKFNSVYICWFGGEPLLQKQVIYDIMETAVEIGKKCGVPIMGQITTNGYQLDLETFEKLNSLNILHYHITIDGPEDVHDKLRPYVNGKGTYKKIMANLIAIKNHSKYNHFSIMIRANTDKKTYLRYSDFIKEVIPIFGDDKRFIFFVQKINDWGGESVKQMSENLLDSEKILWNNTLPQMNNVNTNFGGMRNLSVVSSCSLKTRNSYAFYVDGSVYKCSMAIKGLSSDNDFGKIGELSVSGQINIAEKKIADFAKRPQLLDKCDSCCWLPFCIVAMCPYSVARNNKIRCIVDDFGTEYFDKDLIDDFINGRFIDLTEQ